MTGSARRFLAGLTDQQSRLQPVMDRHAGLLAAQVRTALTPGDPDGAPR